jgi:hypothetical protein
MKRRKRVKTKQKSKKNSPKLVSKMLKTIVMNPRQKAKMIKLLLQPQLKMLNQTNETNPELKLKLLTQTKNNEKTSLDEYD